MGVAVTGTRPFLSCLALDGGLCSQLVTCDSTISDPLSMTFLVGAQRLLLWLLAAASCSNRQSRGL